MFRVCQMATCMFVSAHHLAKRACRAAFACNFLGVNLHDLQYSIHIVTIHNVNLMIS